MDTPSAPRCARHLSPTSWGRGGAPRLAAGDSSPPGRGRATVLEVQCEIAIRLHALVSSSLARPCARRGWSPAGPFPKRLFGLGKMMELAPSLPRSLRSRWLSGLAPRQLPMAVGAVVSKLQGGEPEGRDGEGV